jgi:3-methyladenine DNA glycosylase AlkC
VLADLPRLELKDRIARTSQALHTHLPVTGTEALDVLLRSLPPTPEAAGVANDFGLHIYSPHSDYVARYFRSVEHLEQALDALKRLTAYFTAEVAVRHFLKDFPDETLKAVDAWARDEDNRVRRLASESTRPKLPWAPRLALPADAALPVLDQLCTDSSTYVRTSVANHLHDLSVGQPDLVLATLERWKDSRRITDKDFTFIARGALRSRLKKGWPPAYALLGYAHDAPVDVTPLSLERTELVDGDTLSFSATLTSSAPAPVHVMYVISSTTQRGALREKVYFLTRSVAEPGQPLPLARPHLPRSTATMKLTPGLYSLAIQVNGRRFPAVPFQVLKA